MALDNIHPIAGAAFRGGQYLYSKYKQGSAKKVKSGQAKSQGTGAYAGRFRKARKGLTLEAKYSNLGVLATNETFGLVSDENCVYIMHTAVDQQNCMRNMLYALFRKLLKKGGVDVTSLDAILPAKSFDDGADRTFVFTQIDDGVETVNTTVVTVTGETLKTLADKFLQAFTYMAAGYNSSTSGGSASNDSRPYKLYMYDQDYNTTLGKHLNTVLNLQEEKMHVYGYSDLKIQNRSLAADSGTDKDNVSSNPLVGKTYKFNTIPMPRDKANYLLGAIKMYDSIKLARAAQLEYAFREPPPSTVFTNCKGSSTVRLEPGSIKSSKCSYSGSMMLVTFMQRLGGRYGATGNNYVYESMFPCELFALEDVINVNSSNLITCAYESNQVIGVYFTTHKTNKGITRFSSGAINNLPA